MHLRPDKTPSECEGIWDESQGERSPAVHRDEPDSAPDAALEAADPPEVAFTNLDKVFWPEMGLAKRDLIAYYRRVAPWLLPYLADRPVVLTRYPDGIHGKSFFQKDAPAWVPDWVRTETLWSEHAQREIHYFVCDRIETLLFLANLGTIPLHIWSSRVAALARPDWCILDLDPKEAPFEHVIEVALCLRRFCTAAELPCYVKTSGATGLHILIPLGEQLSYAQSRSLAELLARMVVAARPEIATVARPLRARKGRVYVDYLQNGHGRLLVAPFSLRPLPAAPVSMPLHWREVKRGLDPQRYTLRNAARRMAQLRADPLEPVLDERPDLRGALERLAALEPEVVGTEPRAGGSRRGRRGARSKR